MTTNFIYPNSNLQMIQSDFQSSPPLKKRKQQQTSLSMTPDDTIAIDCLMVVLEMQCEKEINYLQTNEIEKKQKQVKKEKTKEKEKENNNNTFIRDHPLYEQYQYLPLQKYSIKELKGLLKENKLKQIGSKDDLLFRLFCHFKLSYFAIKIQKTYRQHLVKRYIALHGPGFTKRIQCTNQSDFLTMDPLQDMSITQFISYQDSDGFTYGFDILSLYNLIFEGKVLSSSSNISLSSSSSTFFPFYTKKVESQNPYNRQIIPSHVFQMVQDYIQLSKILHYDVNIILKKVEDDITPQKNLELRILGLFQRINLLGNYAEPQWFSSLTTSQLKIFLRELIDIWQYRAQISNEIKNKICPPHGNPFSSISLFQIDSNDSLYEKQKKILTVMERMITSGVDRDSQFLGASYVLGSLTLVNANAAETLPWLYQSFCHISF